MKKIIFIMTFIALAANIAKAQSTEDNKFRPIYRGFGGPDILPLPFKDNDDVYEYGGGGSVVHGYQLTRKLFLGGGFGFYFYENETKEEKEKRREEPKMIDFTGLHLPIFIATRYQFNNKPVAPFVEMRAGVLGMYGSLAAGVHFTHIVNISLIYDMFRSSDVNHLLGIRAEIEWGKNIFKQ